MDRFLFFLFFIINYYQTNKSMKLLWQNRQYAENLRPKVWKIKEATICGLYLIIKSKAHLFNVLGF